MSNHHDDFYSLNCLHSFATENKGESRKKVRENKDFCNVLMPSEDTKILRLNQYQKSNKALFIIHANLKCLTEKIGGCKNNPENSYTTRVSEHISSGFSMSTISFKSLENKHDVYRGKDCIKKFCKSLRKQAINIINYKKMNLLTKEQKQSYENAKIYYIYKEKFENKYVKDKNIVKLEVTAIIQGTVELLRLAYVI